MQSIRKIFLGCISFVSFVYWHTWKVQPMPHIQRRLTFKKLTENQAFFSQIAQKYGI